MRITTLLLLVGVAVLIEPTDGNQNRHVKRDLLVRSKRRWVLSTIELEEERGTAEDYPMVISKMFNDKTEGKSNKFIVSGEGVPDVFSMDEDSGVVYAHRPVDREKKERYHITFNIIDRNTNQPIDNELSFDVEVQDINDNAPTFLQPKIAAAVSENTTEGYLAVQLQVTDKDKKNTPNSRFNLSVISQTPGEPKIDVHQLDDILGQLTFKGCFDYDKAKKYTIVVQAKDQGEKPLSSTAVVTLHVLHSNTHPPKFKEREYSAETLEMTIKDDLLRLAVEDKDKPNTDAWRAKYYIEKGDEEGIFKIVTDLNTNEGVLSVVKAKNYELATVVNLQIGVRNIDDLFVCKERATGGTGIKYDSINVKVKMIDTNDAPVFTRVTTDVYLKEEEKPSQVLYTPKVVDPDSSHIRYELMEDPADWVIIDDKTGAITATKKMDRESPFVDEDVYKVVIAAIDDGNPPATGTSTIRIHLVDINDNTPKLINSSIIMCADKDKIEMFAKDADKRPFTGPFTFFLANEKDKEKWKLDPSFGEKLGLIRLQMLPDGNYMVPLIIEDQQNKKGTDTIHVTVCDCRENNVCPDKMPLTCNFGGSVIGPIIAGLLLFLLLVLTIVCTSKNIEFLELDEGNQTLMMYNLEGGASAYKAEPTYFQSSMNNTTMTDGLKQATKKTFETAPVKNDMFERHNTSDATVVRSFSVRQQRESFRNRDWNATVRSLGVCQQRQNFRNRDWNATGSSFGDLHALIKQTDARIADQIDRRLYMVDRNPEDYPIYQPTTYAYEGRSSKCQSLDELSLSKLEEDLHFLDDLGPKFKGLGNICKKPIQEKKF
ncbi:cadherin-like protein 26 isoform 2-T2 [Pholidichthys leucotaenia]